MRFAFILTLGCVLGIVVSLATVLPPEFSAVILFGTGAALVAVIRDNNERRRFPR